MRRSFMLAALVVSLVSSQLAAGRTLAAQSVRAVDPSLYAGLRWRNREPRFALSLAEQSLVMRVDHGR